MGVDLNTYRQRIGAHAWHACKAGRASPGAWSRASNDAGCDFELSPGADPSGTSFSCGSLLGLTRPQARAGLFVLVLYSALTAIVALDNQPSVKNLHDLSTRILLAGDVETQPGPRNNGTEEIAAADEQPEETSTIHLEEESLAATWERRFLELEKKMETKYQRLEAELDRQKVANAGLVILCEQEFQQMEKVQKEIKQDVGSLRANMESVKVEIQNVSYTCEDYADKNESTARRTNIKLFGVFDTEKESYWDCLQTVLNLFREAIPTVPWSEKDIVRVQRLGPKRRFNTHEPRPIVVEMASLWDKLALLKYGRNMLRSKGIGIASELTSRQAKTLRDLREQGHQAFYRNNRLWFQDTRSNQQKNGRHHYYGNQKRRGQRTQRNRRNGANAFGQQDFGKDSYPTFQPDVQEQTQTQYTHGEYYQSQDWTGTWAHPDDHVTQRQWVASSRGQATANFNDEHRWYHDPTNPPRQNEYGGDYRQPLVNRQDDRRDPQQLSFGERAKGWQRVKMAFAPEAEMSTTGTRRPLEDNLTPYQQSALPDECLEEAATEDEVDDFDEQALAYDPEGYIDENMTQHQEQRQDHGQTRPEATTRQKVQTSLNRWIVQTGKAATLEGDLVASTGTAEERTASNSSASVWHGRLRSTTVSTQTTECADTLS